MSDTSPFGFGRFVPGFDFLQNLAKNASEGSSKMPGLSGWIAPTMSIEDVEKRVDELKAVQFWLEQNSRALTATIQALEVQKMTLSTLKGMNVSMGDMGALFQPKQGGEKPGAPGPAPGDAMTSVAQAMTDAMARATSAFVAPMASMAQASKADDKAAPPASAPAPAPSPAAAAAPAAPAAETASGQTGGGGGGGSSTGMADPMQWWTSLTQQFQQIATSALQDVAQQASLEKAAGMTQDAFKTATDMASQMATATGMKSVQGAAGGAGKDKSAADRKKPASASTSSASATAAAAADAPPGSAGKAAGAPGKGAADASAPAAGKKATARSAAAPTKRARG